MPQRLNLEISESLEELKTLLGQQKTAFGKERVQALYLLKLEQVTTVGELVKCLGRHRVTVQECLGLYRQGDMSALLKSKLDFIHLKLERFWAVPRLQPGSQTFSDIQCLTDIKKSLEKIWYATIIAN